MRSHFGGLWVRTPTDPYLQGTIQALPIGVIHHGVLILEHIALIMLLLMQWCVCLSPTGSSSLRTQGLHLRGARGYVVNEQKGRDCMPGSAVWSWSCAPWATAAWLVENSGLGSGNSTSSLETSIKSVPSASYVAKWGSCAVRKASQFKASLCSFPSETVHQQWSGKSIQCLLCTHSRCSGRFRVHSW